MPKTNIGLVEYAKKALGLPYWNGTFGQVAGESLYNQNKKRLPSEYTAKDFPAQFGKIVHDCCGLIKGYMWKDSFTSNYKYQSNSCPDLDVQGLYKACTAGGACITMPDTPGLLVFLMKGNTAYHVGVYVGNDTVIEAKGHAYGVVRSNITHWDRWGMLSFIQYITPAVTNSFNPKVLRWQKAAIADGFVFPRCGADGEWGPECEEVAKKALVQKWSDGLFRYRNLTALAQSLMNMPKSDVDGLCGNITTMYIKRAQKFHGVPADGGIGASTWKHLLGAA